MRILWTIPAIKALEDIADYVAEDNIPAAYHITETVRRSVEQLSEHPNIGRVGRVDGTRELILPNIPYIVPYRIKRKTIEILSVFHASRRWPQKF